LELLKKFVDVYGDAAAHVVHLVNSDQLIGLFEELVVKRYDYELTVFGSLFDELSDVGSVLEVKGCVDLVHEVNCVGFVLMQCVDE
jgi:hypothetical protein